MHDEPIEIRTGIQAGDGGGALGSGSVAPEGGGMAGSGNAVGTGTLGSGH